MLRRAAEDHHHEWTEVDAYLVNALNILRAHDLDPVENDATLAAVLGLLASKQMVYEQMQPSALGILR